MDEADWLCLGDGLLALILIVLIVRAPDSIRESKGTRGSVTTVVTGGPVHCGPFFGSSTFQMEFDPCPGWG